MGSSSCIILFVCLILGLGPLAVLYSYVEIVAVIANEVVVDWLSCIRRSKNNVFLILVWDHLENKLHYFVCLFDLEFRQLTLLLCLCCRAAVL